MTIEFSQAWQLSPSNGKHHFFGYYGIPPWDATGRYYVCLETTFHDRMPRPGEAAGILLLDLEEGTHEVVADTRAWNFQQGAMIHWLPSDPSSKIVFNDMDLDATGDENGRPFARVLDVFTGDEWSLPRPINAVAHGRDLAACVNFARLRRYRKVTSYPTSHDYSSGGVHPADDGIFLMDLRTGDLELLVSLDEIWNANPGTRMLDDELFAEMGNGLWFNHVAFNPSDTRLHFLARYQNLFKGLETSMWTIGVDGKDPFLLVDFGNRLSHFEWVTDDELIVTMDWPSRKRKSHVRVRDRQGKEAWRTIAPDVLQRDGHCHVNPARDLMATDSYIVDGRRHVYVVELETEKVHEVYSFENPPEFNREVRCDPHPRWSRDGRYLSFDALGPNGRQVHAIEISRDVV